MARTLANPTGADVERTGAVAAASRTKPKLPPKRGEAAAVATKPPALPAPPVKIVGVRAPTHARTPVRRKAVNRRLAAGGRVAHCGENCLDVLGRKEEELSVSSGSEIRSGSLFVLPGRWKSCPPRRSRFLPPLLRWARTTRRLCGIGCWSVSRGVNVGRASHAEEATAAVQASQ